MQAKVKTPAFVEFPKGFESTTDEYNVLKLNKSLYGSSDAPLAWFEALKHSLESRGLKASEIDPCLFIHKNIIVLCFVDSLIYVRHNAVKIDSMIADLGNKFLHTVEDDMTSFLGIQIQTLPDNALLLTQTRLTT